MWNILRWKYVAPRILFVVAVSAALYWGMDPALHWVLIQGCQSATGAKVEIADVATDVPRGQITLTGIAVADPSSPQRNLIAVERAVADVEMQRLLHRKLVIRDAVLDGITISVGRETDGRLPEDAEKDAGNGMFGDMLQDWGKQGEEWFDTTRTRWEEELESELETVKLGQECKERWPQAYAGLDERVRRIEDEGKALRDMIRVIKENPLEHLDQVQPLLAKVEGLRRDVVEVKGQLQQAHQQMQHDRAAFDIARRHDAEYVRQRLRLDELDGNSLSDYLLGPVWAPRIQSALRWIAWSREVTGATREKRDQQARSTRGTTILFPGIPASADVLIQHVSLSGKGTAQGTPFQFIGSLRDLTHQPHRHDQPATIEIRTDGAIQLVARGTLDRRQEDPIDHWVVEVPAWRQNGETLGKTEKLAVQLSPGKASLRGEFTIRDQQIEGTLEVVQDDLQMKPQLHEKYTRFVSHESLAAAVGKIDHLRARLEISGELHKPRCKLQSNLGPAMSQGLRKAAQFEMARREEQLLEMANNQVDEELDSLQQKLVSEHSQILERLEIGDEQMEQIRSLLVAKVGNPSDLLRRGKKLFLK